MAHILLKNKSSYTISVHSGLTGLDADDHTQYHNDTRAETWLTTAEHGDITFENLTATTLEFSGGGELVFSIPSDEFQLNKGLDITGGLTASTGVYGVDFSDVANTAHTHDFSVITNTAHTHSEYYSSGDNISATTLTATTIVRPNGVLKHKFMNCSEFGSTAPYNSFSSNYAQGRMFIALTQDSSSAITQFYLPPTYISGTQITFDYGWVEGTSSPVGPGTRDMYWLASAHPMALEGIDDPTEGKFRFYSLSQTAWTETYSAYSQNIHRVSGIKFTDENGAINGRTVIPGDLIALSMAGLQGTMSSTAWYPMFIQFNYYAEE